MDMSIISLSSNSEYPSASTFLVIISTRLDDNFLSLTVTTTGTTSIISGTAAAEGPGISSNGMATSSGIFTLFTQKSSLNETEELLTLFTSSLWF